MCAYVYFSGERIHDFQKNILIGLWSPNMLRIPGKYSRLTVKVFKGEGNGSKYDQRTLNACMKIA
jgi:hypothetical protein